MQTAEQTSQQLYEKLKNVKVGNPLCSFTEEKCRSIAPLVNEINRLKKEKNAVILAHSYLSPDIVYGVADFSGDSYGLSLKARATKADIIIFAAVDFMAETAKILNPKKTVYKPNRNGGCSLAQSITADDVRELRKKYPEHTFICYINTTADVKAECDITVTSSNVNHIVECIPSNRIFFLPDRLMALNIRDHLQKIGSPKELLFSEGTCYVHEQYTGESIPSIRRQFPEVVVLAHPECKPEVTRQADFVGSTTGMLDYVKGSQQKTFFLMTECGLIGRLEAESPEKRFVGGCMLCKYMKGNTLEDIYRVLAAPCPEDEVTISENIRLRAEKTLHRMIEMTETQKLS